MENPAMCGEKSIHCRILRSRKYFYANRAFCAEKYEEKQREFHAWIPMDFVFEMAKLICKCSINIAVNML